MNNFVGNYVRNIMFCFIFLTKLLAAAARLPTAWTQPWQAAATAGGCDGWRRLKRKEKKVF